MKIPSKVDIRGKTWKVRCKKNLVYQGHVCYGLCDLNKRTIYLNKTLNSSKEKLTDSWAHELVHAIVFECVINLSLKQEEMLCISIARDMRKALRFLE